MCVSLDWQMTVFLKIVSTMVVVIQVIGSMDVGMDAARLILPMAMSIKDSIYMINAMVMGIIFGKMAARILVNLNKISDKGVVYTDGPMVLGIEENSPKDNEMEKENINLPMDLLTKDK